MPFGQSQASSITWCSHVVGLERRSRGANYKFDSLPLGISGHIEEKLALAIAIGDDPGPSGRDVQKGIARHLGNVGASFAAASVLPVSGSCETIYAAESPEEDSTNLARKVISPMW